MSDVAQAANVTLEEYKELRSVAILDSSINGQSNVASG
jgi:hypothetical protein